MSGPINKFSDELLKPNNMLRLYATGAFPMADEKTGAIEWYLPEIRCIIPLDNFNVPRSAKKEIEKQNFEIKFDSDPLAVIRGCADREHTWISEKLIEAYIRLIKRGHLHSVETWQNDKLVGGLYGITFRGVFWGESMFSRVSQASKAALLKLLYHLRDNDFTLLDVQFMTEHLKMFGAVEISLEDYRARLQDAYQRICMF
ncbi:MAG TPA: leucyl/phenylalanyl-tRNA--protein transferase [Ignavibacteriaceae bacterium]|jgi:leucyl/phenylalanyl-tRNA--protein transferase|nr:MAG: Leucyl/phenylalanyl-tRNA--protein transferase [Ignavibacteria bacterium ADurb.Bin266]OQY73682.1 MAG: leucyl/phenylalanyl-tRNA--protein transferase [Ignavibacteriales bacterium UTCHB2]HQF41740.1 leucyl/phenylalanyl-tRNA--protein transferase [Ignavibacteriaceae bacterium]HQI40547.1 leucyl/phenylalanyl-tRNA--protein transferase [Ignavibacteriaceae bacterium]HQJ45818.1 leucyl/phenylalanyl-tRNA--protein transferase [Ignavibacteriaceae bacterium]